MLMNDVPKFVINDSAYLFHRMLRNKGVKEDHFAEAPETGDKCI